MVRTQERDRWEWRANKEWKQSNSENNQFFRLPESEATQRLSHRFKVKGEKNIWRGQQLRSQPLEIHSGKDPTPGELEILWMALLCVLPRIRMPAASVQIHWPISSFGSQALGPCPFHRRSNSDTVQPLKQFSKLNYPLLEEEGGS